LTIGIIAYNEILFPLRIHDEERMQKKELKKDINQRKNSK